jgi:hypothetical protein
LNDEIDDDDSDEDEDEAKNKQDDLSSLINKKGKCFILFKYI